MKGRSRKVAPPRVGFCDTFDGVQALLRRRDPVLDDGGLLGVQGDNGELEVPVPLALDQLHVARVLRPPGRLRGEAQRVVYLLEETQEVKRYTILPLETVELIRQTAPLHDATLLDVRCELAGILVRVPEHTLNLLRVDGFHLLCQIVVLPTSEAPLELREAVQAVK